MIDIARSEGLGADRRGDGQADPGARDVECDDDACPPGRINPPAQPGGEADHRAASAMVGEPACIRRR